MKTITFEDNGQDFLEWDVNEQGIVIDCRPFQKWMWCGCKVDIKSFNSGSHVNYLHPRVGAGQIKYRIEKIFEHTNKTIANEN